MLTIKARGFDCASRLGTLFRTRIVYNKSFQTFWYYQCQSLFRFLKATFTFFFLPLELYPFLFNYVSGPTILKILQYTPIIARETYETTKFTTLVGLGKFVTFSTLAGSASILCAITT